jgi:hypothetical protein
MVELRAAAADSTNIVSLATSLRRRLYYIDSGCIIAILIIPDAQYLACQWARVEIFNYLHLVQISVP